MLRDADVATQLAAFRTVLPDNLIGRHALSHIKWALAPPSWWAAVSSPKEAIRAQSRDLVRGRVVKILENGRHAELNTGIRTLVARECSAERRTPYRLLLGAHDVDAFVDDVASVRTITDLLARLGN